VSQSRTSQCVQRRDSVRREAAYIAPDSLVALHREIILTAAWPSRLHIFAGGELALSRTHQPRAKPVHSAGTKPNEVEHGMARS
jgi:hypothetical protein